MAKTLLGTHGPRRHGLCPHIDYTHINPVKGGLVPTPAAWPFSSLHRYIRQGILPKNWAATNTENTPSGESSP